VGDAHASHSEAATKLGSAVIVHIKEQDAKIQRVSAQLKSGIEAPPFAQRIEREDPKKH
jgi:hypothetical protein